MHIKRKVVEMTYNHHEEGLAIEFLSKECCGEPHMRLTKFYLECQSYQQHQSVKASLLMQGGLKQLGG